MGLPEYDNVSKWAAFFRRLPFWLKAAIILCVVVVLSIWLYAKFGPIQELKQDKADLETSLARAKSEISDLRDRKNELHRENLHLKEIFNPVQRKAEQLYPELETAAAIAKLAEDLETVRSIATRDVYKPLVAQQKTKFIGSLQTLLSRYPSFAPTVTIIYQQGSSSRIKVAHDFKKYLEEAGFKAEVSSVMAFYKGIPPDMAIKFHPDDTEFVKRFAMVVVTFYINEGFQGSTRDKFTRGCFEITINGDPLFTELGVVKFR